MGSASSINPGVANLLQTLSGVDSTVLSSPKTVSALENAPPADIVQLSDDATQLATVNALFGLPNSASDTSDTSVNNLLESLQATLAGSPASSSSTPASQSADNTSSSATTSTTASAANHASSYQTALQQAESQTLLGTGLTSGSSNSLFDLIG